MKLLVFITLFFSLQFIISQDFYTSTYEENILKSIKQDSTQFELFNTMLAIDSTMISQKATLLKQNLHTFIEELKNYDKKSPKKKVKIIYDKLHEKYLKKYEENAYFNQIFDSGIYNCVTASALYAYVFDKLSIPYHVKEAPSHVFLIAYPKTHYIHLETTVPGALGFLVPKENDIKKIIDELIDYKLATQQEVDAKGYKKFYEDYYFGKEFVEPKALVGMQYNNKAITYFEKQDYDKVLHYLQLSKKFHKNPVAQLIEKQVQFMRADELNMESMSDINYMVSLYNNLKFKKDYKKENLLYTCNKITSSDNNDDNFIKKAAERFSTLKDSIPNKIAFEYLYQELARSASTNLDNEEALNYSKKILQKNSKNKIARAIIEHITFTELANSILDKETLKTYEDRGNLYAFLKDNKKYEVGLGILYANISLVAYQNKKYTEAITYRKKFETLADHNKLVIERTNKMLIYQLYYEAGKYPYYKNRLGEAGKIYRKALTYIPTNSDLKKRLQWCKDEGF